MPRTPQPNKHEKILPSNTTASEKNVIKEQNTYSAVELAAGKRLEFVMYCTYFRMVAPIICLRNVDNLVEAFLSPAIQIIHVGPS